MRLSHALLLGVSAISPFQARAAATTPSDDPKCPDSSGEWPNSEPDNGNARPKDLGVVVFPGFEMLDIYGPLDAFRLLSRKVEFNLHILSNTLDPVTTLKPGDQNPFNSKFSTTIQPTHTFEDPPQLDMLLVPGGEGSRSTNLTQHINFIAETYPKLDYILSVCTGAILTAKAGILANKSATTNKAAWNEVIVYGPNTNWIHVARWVVDGNIWSSSGVSAGIDATLAWINHVYGTAVATDIANIMEYAPHKNSSWDPFAGINS